MVIAFVFDPSVLKPQNFSTDDYRKEVESFLQGISENGLIMVDSTGVLEGAILDNAAKLPTRVGQQISIRVAELFKTRERIIRCRADCCPDPSRTTLSEMVYHLGVRIPVDAVVLSEETMREYHERCAVDPKFITATNYRDSKIETQRRRYLTNIPPINELRNEDVRDIFVRVTRYSKVIRIYDKQLGQCTNLSYYRKGFCYVLDAWIQERHFKDNGSVEIITLRKREIDSQENEEAKQKLIKEILEPLKKLYPLLRISLSIKRAEFKHFHPRHLQTDYAILHVDRGFHLFDSRGKLLTNLVNLRNADKNHLEQYRKLPGEDI